MVLVPVDVEYVRQLQPDRIAVFDFTEDVVWRVRQARFGLVIVEGRDQKKLIAVGGKADLIGKARAWSLPFMTRLDFEPESAFTTGGWFARVR